MKNPLRFLSLVLTGLVAGSFPACSDLEVLAPCSGATSIIINDNSPCAVPCTRNFRVANVESLENPRFKWSITDGSSSLPISNDAGPEISVDFPESGDYQLNVQITFDFAGCDQSLPFSFTAGDLPPRASIGADRTECIVGDCAIKFWQENENVDNWTWDVPGNSDNFANQDTIYVSFDDAPGEYTVRLTGSNIEGSATAEVTVRVAARTFVLRGDEAMIGDLGNVLYLEESTSGSFQAIGNNEEITYAFRVNRDGTYDENSLNPQNSLWSFYTDPVGRKCSQINGNLVVIGDAFFDGSDTDFYLASFSRNFNPELETAYKSRLGGNERTFGITAGISQGYVACGEARQTSGISALTLIQLDESFRRQRDTFYFTEGSGGQALDIITLGQEYVVAGNQAGRGFYFRLNANLDLIDGSFTDLGSDLTSPSLLKTGERSFMLIGRNGENAVIQTVDDGITGPKNNIGLSRIRAARILAGGRLALVGYRGTAMARIPLLLVYESPQQLAEPVINETFLTSAASGELRSLEQTSDGGFILGGSVGLGFNLRALIIRTNALGKI